MNSHFKTDPLYTQILKLALTAWCTVILKDLNEVQLSKLIK